MDNKLIILTSLVVILSLTQGVTNILKAVTCPPPEYNSGSDSETDTHCTDVIFPLSCANQIANCPAAAQPSLLVVALY